MLVKVIGGFVAFGVLAGLTGMLMQEHIYLAEQNTGVALFPFPEDMLVPGVVLTVLLTLLFAFATPLGPAVFSAFSGGDGASLVIFGGGVPLALPLVVFGFVALSLIAAAVAVIALCLVDIAIIKLRSHR